MPHRRLLLDACVAINLAATDKLPDIAEALDITFVMAAQAVAEAGYLRDLSDGDLVLTPINWRSLVPGNALQIAELDAAEFALYLDLAEIVDDGEAATIAMAILRGLNIATDDRKARRLCLDRSLTEPVRTIALLRSYAEVVGSTADQLRELLTRVRDRASFQPPRADPNLSWWVKHLADS